jgi:hypothetical protein
MKLSKQKGIELIVAELENGTATNDIFGVIRSKSELAESTFYDWLKIAKEQHKHNQQPIKEAVKAQTIDAEIEAKKTALKRREKRLSILNKKFDELAEMQPKTLSYIDPKTGDKVEVKITKADYLKGIEVLARLDDRISKAEGTDAPSKQEQTILDKRIVDDIYIEE